MTRADEFTSFYEATSATCLRAVYAMSGDRQVAQEATVDAYRRAWRNWTKIRQRDPLAYVRTEAWKLTAVSRGTHPLRRRHEEDADTALLDALHDLPVDDRRLIVLLTLGDTDLDQASREVGVGAEEGIEVVTTALDGLERRLGPSPSWPAASSRPTATRSRPRPGCRTARSSAPSGPTSSSRPGRSPPTTS
jgi:DNA-directed RNA polymerase specialized sigma24 family protein